MTRAGHVRRLLVVLRHLHDPDRDVAFIGGIGVCHGRRPPGSAPAPIDAGLEVAARRTAVRE